MCVIISAKDRNLEDPNLVDKEAILCSLNIKAMTFDDTMGLLQASKKSNGSFWFLLFYSPNFSADDCIYCILRITIMHPDFSKRAPVSSHRAEHMIQAFSWCSFLNNWCGCSNRFLCCISIVVYTFLLVFCKPHCKSHAIFVSQMNCFHLWKQNKGIPMVDIPIMV